MEAADSMKSLAIVVREDAFDRLLTPLTFAYVAASRGVQVDMLFVLWAVRVLTEDGARYAKVGASHAHEADWLDERLRRTESPRDLYEFMKLIKNTGNARFHGCKLAAATFGVEPSRMIPEADGVVDAMWFLEERAMKADHCQYF